MKGYFTIRHDPYEGHLYFGNLGLRSHNPHTLIIGNSSTGFFDASRVIAHDLIEHSVNHRKNYDVTFEEEFRALGAMYFTRGIELQGEISTLTVYLHRKIKPVNPIIVKHLRKNYGNFVDYDEFNLSKTNIDNINDQINYGRYLQEKRFRTHSNANAAFRFIQEYSKDIIYDILSEESFGASIYFDTNMQVIRHKHKRQPFVGIL